MTLTFAQRLAQRLGVRPVRLPPDGRRVLLAARAASVLRRSGAPRVAAAAAAGDLGFAAVLALVACWSLGSVELHASASIGAAVYPSDSFDATGLFAPADAAMYDCKSRIFRLP